jgi:hypothetical protein
MEAVNQRFLTYGSPRFDKYLDPSKFGPGLSSASLDDRKQRFGSAFEGSVTARAMGCVACHQPARFGSLNWPMDSTLIESFVTGGEMPYGYKLRDSERLDLYDKLIEEYFATNKDHPGILKSWLLSKPQQKLPVANDLSTGRSPQLHGHHLGRSLNHPLTNAGDRAADLDLATVRDQGGISLFFQFEIARSFEKSWRALTVNYNAVVLRRAQVCQPHVAVKDPFDRANTSADCH